MLKVGQKVRVRKDLKVGTIYSGGTIFTSEMGRYLERNVIIKEIIERDSICEEPFYKIEGDKWGWNWSEKMFEPICNKDTSEYFGFDDVKQYTFEEVTRIGEDGDEFINTNKSSSMSKITFSNGVTYLSSLEVNRNDVFIKYVEKKEKYVIYKVEHREGQKQYDFISDNIFLEEGMMVICNTKYGKTYGRIVSKEEVFMTISEANEYKKCSIIKE